MAKTETSLIELKDYEGKYNVLFPQSQMTQISPYHRIRVEEVKINPDPEGGDVFKVGARKAGNGWQDVLSLSKTGILKLATAAGIVWNWNETRVLSSSKDYVLYQAVGAMRKPSGEWIPLKATKEIDLDVIEAETYESNLKKAESMKPDQLKGMTPEQWADMQTRTNMIQWKKNKLMRAETGAMLRVVRALLSIKHQYSPQELKKPFAVPTVDFTPDYSDPEVKRMIAEQSLKAASDLFGLGQPTDAGAFLKQQQEQPPYLGAPINVTAKEDYEEDPPADVTDEDFPWEGQQSFDQEEDDTPVCSGCGTTEMSQKVIDYSIKNYGQPLCMKCQRKGGDQK